MDARGAQESRRHRLPSIVLAVALAVGAVADAVTTCIDAPAVYRSEANPVSRFCMSRIGAAPYMTLAAAVMVAAALWVATGRRTPPLLLIVIIVFAVLEPAVALNNTAKDIHGSVLVSPTTCARDSVALLSSWLLPALGFSGHTHLGALLRVHVGWSWLQRAATVRGWRSVAV